MYAKKKFVIMAPKNYRLMEHVSNVQIIKKLKETKVTHVVQIDAPTERK